jgi:hypothetical protein
LRQYWPAEAGVAKLTKAKAYNAVAGAAVNFKNRFMLLSLSYSLLLRAVFQPLSAHMGARHMSRCARMAVPLAIPLLARTDQHSYVCRFWSE